MDFPLTTELVLDKLDKISELHTVDPTNYLNAYQGPRASLSAGTTIVSKVGTIHIK